MQVLRHIGPRRNLRARFPFRAFRRRVRVTQVVQYMELFKTPNSSQTSVYSDSFYYYSEIYETMTPNSTARYDQDVPDGHGTHTAGTAAGAMVADHLKACPAGQVSGCVGKCLTIEEATKPRDGGAFDLDTRCPAFGCAENGSEHTSGCLSNDATRNVEQSGGVARGAKLAVFDVSGGGQWRSMEVGNDLWAVSAETGAKVHSNSWGMADAWCAFGEWDVQYDAFMYEVSGPRGKYGLERTAWGLFA